MRTAISIAVLAACHGGEHKPPAPRAMPVELATLQPTQVVDSTEYLATLRPLTAIALQPQIEGHVTEIRVAAGDRVAAGQLLMQIDPGPQPAVVARSRASRAARQASLALAETNLARTRKLVDEGALARQELDNAQAAESSARGDVAALGAEISSNAVQLRYYRITAPSAGVVGDIPVRVGDLVNPQTRLTSVTDNHVLEVNLAVPVERAAAVKPGMRIEIVDDEARVVAEGDVSFISPQVASDTQSVLVKANIANPPNLNATLRAEQLTRGRVVWRIHEGITVPALAVIRLGGQTFVYVAAEANGGLVARQTPVTLGELTNNVYVVDRGLDAGTRIVVSQIQKLHDGAPITPGPPGGAPPPGSGSGAPSGAAGSGAAGSGSGGSGGSGGHPNPPPSKG